MLIKALKESADSLRVIEDDELADEEEAEINAILALMSEDDASGDEAEINAILP
jgi:hypothetical protein